VRIFLSFLIYHKYSLILILQDAFHRYTFVLAAKAPPTHRILQTPPDDAERITNR
jgi:hypothetical protein